ncbi:MAG: acyl-CoA synthetase [Solirubrobacteraceae bacterium]
MGPSRMRLLDATGPEQACAEFSWQALWSLFDGDEGHLNIAHECLDRHEPAAVAARIAYADGRVEEPTFGELSRASAQFAHALVELGIEAGDRVGVMMEPSPGFYTAVFGALKRGAVVAPLYTLFGPAAVRDRLDDCHAALLIVDESTEATVRALDYRVLRYDTELLPLLAAQPDVYEPRTAASDLAVLQYTSGTTRQLPEGVPHDHRAIVTLARAGIFALGLKPGDRFFCPSSPAWGHGLWHGTIAPWSLGVALGTSSGRFAIDTVADAVRDLEITNLAAASTVYRMLLQADRLSDLRHLVKASYTGEELDASAQAAFKAATGIPVCGMYGTTETGVLLANYPGFAEYEPRLGALGKPLPGCEVAILLPDGSFAPPDVVGEISVRRRSKWFGAKDLGTIDGDGYFHYGGRADDVIISAGWTISPLEVERTLLSHPDVSEAAVIGAPDPLRGLIVKAYLVAGRDGEEFVAELQQLVRTELSPHEYPRAIEFVDILPKTPNGKVDRRTLRARQPPVTQEV